MKAGYISTSKAGQRSCPHISNPLETTSMEDIMADSSNKDMVGIKAIRGFKHSMAIRSNSKAMSMRLRRSLKTCCQGY